MEPVTFTFAIVNWNTRDLLDACLASIFAARGEFAIQVLVADNASQDGSAEMVEQKYPRATLVRTGGNIGFARGHAALLPHGRGAYYVLVNSDVRLLPGCLEIVHQRMTANPEIGILGCRIIGPDDRVQPSCRRFPGLGYQFLEASGLSRLFPRNGILNAYKMGDFKHDHSREVDQVMGAFFLIKDQVIREIGFLDPAFFMYYEEVDYCLRAREAGFRVFFEAEAAVRHLGGGSSRMVKVATIRRTMRSMRHYFKKHHGGWTYLFLIAIVSLDLVTHFVHALMRRDRPAQTLKAYALGWWDVVRLKRADA